MSVLTIEEEFDGDFLVTLGDGLSRSKVAAPAVKEKEAQEAARIDSIGKFSSYCSEQPHPCLNKDLIAQEIIAMMRLSKKMEKPSRQFAKIIPAVSAVVKSIENIVERGSGPFVKKIFWEI